MLFTHNGKKNMDEMTFFFIVVPTPGFLLGPLDITREGTKESLDS